jgi:intracellular septation protein
MKILFDLFPVILFFITYHATGDIFIATSVTMGASLVQIIFSWVWYRKVDALLWISFILIIILGSATLVFHDQLFIYWKPTALYWIMAISMVLLKAIKGINLIKKLMGTQLTLPEPTWTRLNLAWALFFTVLGGLNLLIAFNFSQTFWVNFKLFGTTGLTLIFIVIQTILLSKYIREDKPKVK